MWGPDRRVFQATWDATVLLDNALVCTNCGQIAEELQYLGTICKHVYCWHCIKDLSKASFPVCELCSSPLEPAKPTPARTVNSLAKGTRDLQKLLNMYENAAIAEGNTALPDLIGSSRTSSPPRRSVAEFLATQQLAEDDEGDDDVFNSPVKPHPPTRMGSATPSDQKRGQATPLKTRPPSRNDKSSSKKKARASRSRTNSGCSSISIELDDYAEEKPSLTTVKEEESVQSDVFKTEPTENSLSPILPKWDVKPLATSTQVPTLFMTQQMPQNDPLPVTPAVVPQIATGRSFEFTKKPAVAFGATDAKHQKLFSSGGLRRVKEESVKRERRSDEFSPLLPKKGDLFSTPTRPAAEPRFDPNMLTLERGAPRKSLTHRRAEREVITAVMNADLDKLQTLIAADADLNELDPELGTPLFIAASNGNLKICEMLVEHGAIINAHCGNECNTALHIAVKNEHEEVAHYLMSKGAGRQVRNIRNMTPAQMADSCSPMRKLVEKYKKYPKQPSIPPRLPSHIVICVDDQAQRALATGLLGKARRYLEVETDLTSDTTHFAAVVDSEGIANGSNQKLITAMLRGLKVVTLNYITDTVKVAETIRDWCPYEVGRIRFREHPVAEGSVSRCRRAKERFEPGLLKGCKFFIYSKQFPTYGKRPFLSNVIQLAGGEVMNREPVIDDNDPLPFHKQDLDSPYFILYEQGTKVPQKFLDEAKYQLVTPGWLFESITSYEFLQPY